MVSQVLKACEVVLSGRQLKRYEVDELYREVDTQELFDAADEIRKHFMGTHFHLCSIINARSGNCSEDCKFCAQSAQYPTSIETYDRVDTDKALEMAMDNDSYDVHRISLVTSGRTVSEKFLHELAEIYGVINDKTSLRFCASMGLLNRDKAKQLSEMGVSRYHCNLEASRNYFPNICTTHSWKDKVETLGHARDTGMTLCSGGIMGMGESMADRIDLAFELRDLHVKSIPMNVLTPIPDTPFAELEPLEIEEVLTTLALFRFINPDSVIRIAGGRQQLGDDQYRCFAAGANGAIVGDYLTTIGSRIADDLKVLAEMGYTFS